MSAKQVKVKKVLNFDSCLNTPRAGDVGYDLSVEEDVYIPAGQTKIVSTGVAMEMPDGTAAYVIPRSSMLATRNIHISTGLIDTNYRGVIKVVMHNLGSKTEAFKAGDRVAQVVFFTTVRPEVKYVYNLSDTNRGEGGFGSTGSSKLSAAPKHDKMLAVTRETSPESKATSVFLALVIVSFVIAAIMGVLL